MNITPETPRHDITCAGMTFSAPAPYTEGHPLTETEAAVLNQTLAENLRNNFANQVKKAAAEAEALAKETGEEVSVDAGALATAFEEYVAGYEFGVRRTGTSRGPVDPVEKEAMALATGKVKAALKAKGLAIKDVEASKIKELAEAALEKYPQLREQAAQLVAMKQAAASEELDLDL